MATIKQGILGGLSGTIGPAVGGSWKGINYIRSLPVSVANPDTTPQRNQRNKFSFAVAMAKALLASWIKPLFDRFAIQQSGYNVWMSENTEKFNPDTGVLTSPPLMAKGTMTPLAVSTCVLDQSSSNAVVTWPTALPDNLSANNDEVYFAILNPTFTQFLYAGNTGAVRSAGTVTINGIQGIVAGQAYRVFLVARNAEGLRISDQFTGLVTAVA